MWGPEDRGRNCWIVGAVVRASHARRFPRRGGEETRDSQELQVGRTGWRERIMRSRGSFQQEVAYCFCIKWWATTFSAALMRKWLEQCTSQLSISFYHLQQMFQGKCVTIRILLGKNGGVKMWSRRAYIRKRKVPKKRDSETSIRKKENSKKKNIERREWTMYFSIY